MDISIEFVTLPKNKTERLRVANRNSCRKGQISYPAALILLLYNVCISLVLPPGRPRGNHQTPPFPVRGSVSIHIIHSLNCAVVDLRGCGGTYTPNYFKFCSFWVNLANWYVDAPSRPRVLAPPSRTNPGSTTAVYPPLIGSHLQRAHLQRALSYNQQISLHQNHCIQWYKVCYNLEQAASSASFTRCRREPLHIHI